MQVHSIISNTISEEILQTGHISIRLLGDGFSLLLEDKNYSPVILNRFSTEYPATTKSIVSTCRDWMERHTLLTNFIGESTFIVSSSRIQLIPEDLFSQSDAILLLESQSSLPVNHTVSQFDITNRPFIFNFAYPQAIKEFTSEIKGVSRIFPSLGVLLSLADQIDASNHQRGFCLLEFQPRTLSILCIRGDEVLHSIEISLKQEEDFIYHSLNVFKQIGFSQGKTPVFISGISSENRKNLLAKYFRNIHPVNYFIPAIDKSYILEHTLLAEATKCE